MPLPTEAPAGPAPAASHEAEIGYISGVDSAGNAAASDWWQAEATVPRKWGSAIPGTPGGTVQFSFSPDYWWTAADQQRIVAGLALWSAVANVQFQQVAYDPNTPAAITFHYAAGEGFGATGTAEYAQGTPIGSLAAAETTFNPYQLGLNGTLGSFTAFGGYGVETILHEEGHLLGLGHAGPYNETVNPATQQLGPDDSRLWSVMSYINPADTSARYHSYYEHPGASWGTDASGYPLVPTTWMPLDILAVQRLYGVPTNTPLSGGQTFGFHCNVAGAIEPFFDFTVNQHPVVTLWDAGLGNTLDVSGFASPATIDLRPGAFSSVDGMTDNIAIAFGVAIDAAVGGPGDDQFVVNAHSDSIVGNGGSDAATFTSGGVVWTDTGGAARIVAGGGVADTLVGIGALAFTGGADTIVTHGGGDFLLAGGHNRMFLDAQAARVEIGGADTLIGGAGALDVTAQGGAGAGSNFVWAAGGPLTFVGGYTPDTVVASAATVTGGVAALQVYGIGSDIVFQGGAGFDEVVASSGRVVAQAGIGGALMVGGPAGDNLLSTSAGMAIVFAGGAGDLVTFGNAAADTAVLASGAETVQGSAATAGFQVYTEAADALVVGGPASDSFDLGRGQCTLSGGGGLNAFVFINGQAGGHDVITDWDPSRDYVFLVNYGAAADGAAVASQVQSGGSTVVTLADHTQITFLGTHGVGAPNFA